MALKIVHYDDPILRKKGEPIKVFDKELAALAEAMIATMHEAAGIGLAAQQVGHAIQLCVVDLRESKAAYAWELDGARPPKDLFMPLVLVNPTFKVLPGDETIYEEGCLSFPGIHGDVVRPDVIRVTFQDLQGVTHTLLCDDLLARCIQHEVDHLNGKLFIDRMEKKVRKTIDDEVRALVKRTRDAAAPATPPPAV